MLSQTTSIQAIMCRRGCSIPQQLKQKLMRKKKENCSHLKQKYHYKIHKWIVH